MMRPTPPLRRIHASASTVVIAALTAACLIGNTTSVHAEERATPVIGSFAVGGSVTAGIDEDSGAFAAQIPVAGLPGVDGNGAVSLGASYSQDLARAGTDPFGLGAGWGWNVSRVEVNGGVRVTTPSGEVYTASQEVPLSDPQEFVSGLEQYVQDDLVFSQVGGMLPARDGVGEGIPYYYSLEYLGGATDYFSQSGHIVARVDAYGYRAEWVWRGRELLRVIDGAGSQLSIEWSGDSAGARVTSPPRSDGVVAETVLDVSENRLSSISDPAKDRVSFAYDASGLIDRVESPSGAVTEITYQPLPNNHVNNGAMTVDQVRVVDSNSGAELSKRNWKVIGEHNPQGSPTYSSAAEMWGAGDGQYRYETEITDGHTRVRSEYNSMGLLLGREITVSTSQGEVPVHEQSFVYAGTEGGGVPERQKVPEQYAKPTTTRVIYRDGAGNARTVTENTEFDKNGRVTKHTAADGTVTTTVYDTQKPNDRALPIGLVLEQTINGHDNTIAKNVNTLTADRKAVAATEMFVGTETSKPVSKSYTTFTLRADGFVTEQKVVATNTSSASTPVTHTESPTEVVTRFDRVTNPEAGTVMFSRTDASGTTAEATTTTLMDIATGLALQATDATQRVASSRYDAAGRVVSQTDVLNRTTTIEYGKAVTRVTDPLGITISEYVDVLGQVVRVTDNISTKDGVSAPEAGRERVVETRTYDNNYSKITVTDARGLTTVTESDVFGRPTKVTGASGMSQVTEYDDVANKTRSGMTKKPGLLGAERITESTLDDNNRTVLQETVREDGVQVPKSTATFDGLGRPKQTSSGDVSTQLVFNPDGSPRTTTTTPANPQEFPGETVTANREHDLFGTSTKKTLTRSDGDNREGVERVLDAAGRTVEETNQDGHLTTYTYSVDGLVEETHNHATGVVTRNTYDPQTRSLVRAETRNAADVVLSATGFEYDPLTGVTTSVFELDDPDGSRIRYAYDIRGNVTQISYPDDKKINHRFDEHGRKTTSTDVVGNITEFVYDRIGLLSRVTQTSPAGAPIAEAKYTYDDFGRTTKLSRDNNVVTTYTFTSANEVKTEKTVTGAGETILDASYVYDTHGNLVSRTDRRSNGTDVRETVAETTTYTYDAYNQLTSSRHYTGATAPNGTPPGEPVTEILYTIGVSGDVSEEIITTNSGTTTRTFDNNALGQTTTITTSRDSGEGQIASQIYDQAGNLTHAADGTQYTYNVHNQPTKETRPDGTTTDHTYWATGQRRTTTTTTPGVPTPSETVGMYWDAASLINETHAGGTPETDTLADSSPASGNGTKTRNGSPQDTETTGARTEADVHTTASYLIGNTRHARTLSTPDQGESSIRTNHFVTNRHGNTTATTDKHGAVTAAYAYTDYGTPTIQSAPGYAQTGAERNPIQYAGEYTTATGEQYLQARTYNPRAMAFTTRDIAQQFNLYAYGNSNPITLVDPSGQSPLKETIINGIFIGAEILILTVTVVMAFVTWGSSLLALGFAIPALVVDGTPVGISTAQIIDDNIDGTGFITDEDSETLTWINVGFGFASIFTGFATGIASLASKARRGVASSTEFDALDAANSTVEKYLAQTTDIYAQPLRHMIKNNPEWKSWFAADMQSPAKLSDIPNHYRSRETPLTSEVFPAATNNLSPELIDVGAKTSGQSLANVIAAVFRNEQQFSIMGIVEKEIDAILAANGKTGMRDDMVASRLFQDGTRLKAEAELRQNYRANFLHPLAEGIYRNGGFINDDNHVPWQIFQIDGEDFANNESWLRNGWTY